MPRTRVTQTVEETTTPQAPAAPVEKTAWPVLTPEETEQCRSRANGKKIYRYENCGQVFVYTGLTRSEWNTLSEKWSTAGDDSSIAEQDEDTCRAGVLWPNVTDPNFWSQTGLAGHAPTLASLIGKTSGFTVVLQDGTVLGDTLVVTELDPQDEVQPDPTEEEIEAFKQKSPNGQAFAAIFDPQHKYVFIPLPRANWMSINNRIKKNPELDAATETIKECVLWPLKDYEQEMAGIVARLWDSICQHSGFNAEAQIIEI